MNPRKYLYVIFEGNCPDTSLILMKVLTKETSKPSRLDFTNLKKFLVDKKISLYMRYCALRAHKFSLNKKNFLMIQRANIGVAVYYI